MSEQPEPTSHEAPATQQVSAEPPPPASKPAPARRDRFPAWSRYLVVGLAGLVLGGLLGWGITATALHNSGPGDGRGHFRHYGPHGPGPRFGPGWYNRDNGRFRGPVSPYGPNQPSPTKTPSPGLTS